MKCKDIMTSDLETCTPDDTCKSAAQLLCAKDCGSLPVVADKTNRELVGIVTDRDICCRLVAAGRDVSTRVGDVMTSKVVACREEDPVQEAERIMRECQIRRVPVIDDDGKVCGIVSQADIARVDRSNLAGVVLAISQPVSSNQASATP